MVGVKGFQVFFSVACVLRLREPPNHASVATAVAISTGCCQLIPQKDNTHCIQSHTQPVHSFTAKFSDESIQTNNSLQGTRGRINRPVRHLRTEIEYGSLSKCRCPTVAEKSADASGNGNWARLITHI